MVEPIRSLQNPKVKLWSSLLERKHRQREGLFLLEGVHLVEEALMADASLEQIVYAEEDGLPPHIGALADKRGVPCQPVSHEVFMKCTSTVTPQGVFAVVQKPKHDAADILARHRSLVIAVDRVQDPGNLGTIIRSADARGRALSCSARGPSISTTRRRSAPRWAPCSICPLPKPTWRSGCRKPGRKASACMLPGWRMPKLLRARHERGYVAGHRQ